MNGKREGFDNFSGGGHKKTIVSLLLIFVSLRETSKNLRGTLSVSPLRECMGFRLSNVHIAYVDDLLVVNWSKFTWIKSVLLVSRLYGEIGLRLNIDKCEYLVFNSKSSTKPLDCGLFSVKCVESFRWLGINICKSLTLLRFRALSGIKEKLKWGYAKIVPNRRRYNKKALAKLYSSFLLPCGFAPSWPSYPFSTRGY